MLPMTALLEYCLTVGQHTKAISGQPVRAVEYNIHKDFFTTVDSEIFACSLFRDIFLFELFMSSRIRESV